MAYVEIWKDDKLLERRALEADEAQEGSKYPIRLGPGQEVRVAVGESVTLGEYEIRVCAGSPPEAGPQRQERSTMPVASGEGQEDATVPDSQLPTASDRRPGPDRDKAHEDGHDKTAPVGKYEPNSWGLYDMHGNAWEWCADWYTERYPRASDEVDPTGPKSGKDRVVRGGSWYQRPQFCRSGARNKFLPHGQWYDLGFRVAMTAKGASD